MGCGQKLWKRLSEARSSMNRNQAKNSVSAVAINLNFSRFSMKIFGEKRIPPSIFSKSSLSMKRRKGREKRRSADGVHAKKPTLSLCPRPRSLSKIPPDGKGVAESKREQFFSLLRKGNFLRLNCIDWIPIQQKSLRLLWRLTRPSWFSPTPLSSFQSQVPVPRKHICTCPSRPSTNMPFVLSMSLPVAP